MTVGYQAALAAQIPHSIILFSSFEYFNWALTDEDSTFTKYDDYTFAYKFLQRFGASTISITLATAVCYPFDTLKRRYQLEATPGHARRVNNLNLPRTMWLSDGKIKGFYRGFSLAMARAIPLAFV